MTDWDDPFLTLKEAAVIGGLAVVAAVVWLLWLYSNEFPQVAAWFD